MLIIALGSTKIQMISFNQLRQVDIGEHIIVLTLSHVDYGLAVIRCTNYSFLETYYVFTYKASFNELQLLYL